MISNLATIFDRLSSRVGNGLLFLAGAVGAFALPPFGYWFLFFVPMGLAVLKLDRCRSGKEAFFSGWWVGFGYFLCGLWWIGAAFFVDQKYLWALPLAVLALPAGLAFFFAGAFAVAHLMWRPGMFRVVVLATSMTLFEIFRSQFFSGFPWNTIGMVFGSDLVFAQSASVIGSDGLSFVVAFLFSCPALFLTERTKTQKLSALLITIFGIGIFYSFGVVRLQAPPLAVVPDVHIRIMQPSIPQDEKFSPENSASILKHYLSMSTRGSYPDAAGMGEVTHLIWPETALPFLLDRTPKAREEIAHILKGGAVLLTGAVRAEDKPDHSGRVYFNSIQMLDATGTIRASSDKVHLVPFGEYIPFAHMIDIFGLRDFVSAPGGFAAAPSRTSLPVPRWPLTLPLICYEAIFSQESRFEDDARPGLLLNVTNDAWFGQTPGPYQHFAHARLRAIELGLPLIRAANNGLSAFVDPYGRILAHLDLNERGVIDGELPISLAETAYSRLFLKKFHPLWLFIGLIGALFTIGQLIPRRVAKVRATSDR